MAARTIEKPERPDVALAERRRHRRFSVSIDATLHSGGNAQPTVIDDISAGGAGLKGAIGIFANDQVEIELGDGRRLTGTVAWWMSGCCGVQFHVPLPDGDPLLSTAAGN